MAKQTSIITLNGKVGGLSFYKTKDGHMARERGGVSKSRIMTDPRFARTRENMREFSEAASTVKLLKDAIRPAIIKSSDAKLHLRLHNAMMQIVKSDPVNSRGERKAVEGDWDILQDMELNANAGLTGTLRAEFSVANIAASLTIAFPAFKPADYVISPIGTTHFRIFAYGASMTAGSRERSLVKEESPLFSVLDNVAEFSLVVEKSSLAEEIQLYLLGIEFIQVVNGEEYVMNNGAHNAAVILLIERA